MLETLLLQAGGLLTLTENTIRGCRLLVDAQTNPEMDEDLSRVLAHVLEGRRMLDYLTRAVRRTQEAQSDNGHDLWEDAAEDEES
jgi:hypothetical protein